MAEEQEFNEDNRSLPGFYRAKVVDNKDDDFYGRIKVWCPDTMQDISEDDGILALPANNPISGLNDDGDDEHFYSGSCYVPPKGSWIWVFYEANNPSRPYYVCGLNLENTKVLPECQTGGNPQKKWVIYKSRMGRCIVISDDTDDERVEICGKKRNISDDPSGDKDSVTTIDGNMSTVLIDERGGKEKVLIRTVKGDFVHIDIDEQQLQIKFEKDIQILTNKSFFLTAKEDINILAEQKINIQSKEGMNIKVGENLKMSTEDNMDIKSGGYLHTSSANEFNIKAGTELNMDGGPDINENKGNASEAEGADDATKADPKGERDT